MKKKTFLKPIILSLIVAIIYFVFSLIYCFEFSNPLSDSFTRQVLEIITLPPSLVIYLFAYGGSSIYLGGLIVFIILWVFFWSIIKFIQLLVRIIGNK